MGRVLLRTVGCLLGLVLLAAGGWGLARVHAGESTAVVNMDVRLRSRLDSLGVDHTPIDRTLTDPVLSYAIPVMGLGLLLVAAAAGRRRPSQDDAEAKSKASKPKAASDGKDELPSLSRAARKQFEKEAELLIKDGDYEQAAGVVYDAGNIDRAVELYAQAGQHERAAEIRRHQERPIEAAELYLEAGRSDVAARCYAEAGAFEKAGECFVERGQHSLAAEMFEKDNQHQRAAHSYSEAGFHRPAAEAYKRCEAWAEAAQALEAAIVEDFSHPAAMQDPKGRKQLHDLALEAGQLYEAADQLEQAVAVLERGRCFSEAAEVAARREDFDKVSELYIRADDTEKAAEALRKAGRATEAAHMLGTHLRDHGEDEPAAKLLEESGDFAAAAEVYAKLEDFARAATCFERAGDAAAAAEMYRASGETARAAEHYELASQFGQAAICWGELGNVERQAQALDQAGCYLQAGRMLAEGGDADRAIQMLQKVEASSTDYRAASALLGDLFRQKNMLAVAEKKLREAAGGEAANQENIEIYYNLARVLEAKEEYPESAELYERILAFQYGYADAETRLETVREQLALAPQPAAADDAGEEANRKARYEIVGELGRGGMGIVYEAKDSVLDRIVAYKVLPDALKENPQALKNFLREAKSAAQLNHPNIVTVYDAGEQDGRYYIAMECVEGTNLKAIVRRRGAINSKGVLVVTAQLCAALAYAHEKKIVHRDIKTANIMWTHDKKAKIMDFGLARAIEGVRNQTTLVSGTPYYMSPEQTLGRNVDHRSDIYSLGVTAFELATGQLPFREGNVPYHHVHTPAPDPRSENRSVAEPLAQIINRCLRKNPDERYASAREILQEAKRALGGDAGESEA